MSIRSLSDMISSMIGINDITRTLYPLSSEGFPCGPLDDETADDLQPRSVMIEISHSDISYGRDYEMFRIVLNKIQMGMGKLAVDTDMNIRKIKIETSQGSIFRSFYDRPSYYILLTSEVR